VRLAVSERFFQSASDSPKLRSEYELVLNERSILPTLGPMPGLTSAVRFGAAQGRPSEFKTLRVSGSVPPLERATGP